jgi:uncharacterized protein
MAELPGTIRDYVIERVAVDPGEGIVLAEPVDGSVRVSRTNRGLLVRGHASAALADTCSRCLRPIEVPLELAIDEEVLPSIDLASGAPVPLEEDGDPEGARLTDHHELELRPLVVEAICLQEPIAPLCEPDCPGLCVECGARLADDPSHGHDRIDPRWAGLAGYETTEKED